MQEQSGNSYLLVFINPVEGKEQEFNDWYTNIHIHEVCQVKGVLSAQRFRLHKTQLMADQPYKYVAIYGLEHGKETEAVNNLNAATPSMNMAPVAQFDLAGSMVIESISDLVLSAAE